LAVACALISISLYKKIAKRWCRFLGITMWMVGFVCSPTAAVRLLSVLLCLLLKWQIVVLVLCWWEWKFLFRLLCLFGLWFRLIQVWSTCHLLALINSELVEPFVLILPDIVRESDNNFVAFMEVVFRDAIVHYTEQHPVAPSVSIILEVLEDEVLALPLVP
jgi:hypothetical protein